MSELDNHTPQQASWQERLMPGRFEGMTVIVTGAGSGIGRSTALRVAAEGGRVVCADWSREALDALVTNHPNLDLVPVSGDVADSADANAIAGAAQGRCDGLVNNAGVMDQFAPIHEVDDEVWDRVFRVNVTGLMRVTRAVLPLMIEAQRGSVVNVSSAAGLRGGAAGVAYTASKHAVIGITRQSSVMYALDGIRVNAVAPGGVNTNLAVRWASERAVARLTPLLQGVAPPPVEPEVIAATITWLLSDDAPNITGVTVPSDGGWSAI